MYKKLRASVGCLRVNVVHGVFIFLLKNRKHKNCNCMKVIYLRTKVIPVICEDYFRLARRNADVFSELKSERRSMHCPAKFQQSLCHGDAIRKNLCLRSFDNARATQPYTMGVHSGEVNYTSNNNRLLFAQRRIGRIARARSFFWNTTRLSGGFMTSKRKSFRHHVRRAAYCTAQTRFPLSKRYENAENLLKNKQLRKFFPVCVRRTQRLSSALKT